MTVAAAVGRRLVAVSGWGVEGFPHREAEWARGAKLSTPVQSKVGVRYNSNPNERTTDESSQPQGQVSGYLQH